jgi:hypothetical protein
VQATASISRTLLRASRSDAGFFIHKNFSTRPEVTGMGFVFQEWFFEVQQNKLQHENKFIASLH